MVPPPSIVSRERDADLLGQRVAHERHAEAVGERLDADDVIGVVVRDEDVRDRDVPRLDLLQQPRLAVGVDEDAVPPSPSARR